VSSMNWCMARRFDAATASSRSGCRNNFRGRLCALRKWGDKHTPKSLPESPKRNFEEAATRTQHILSSRPESDAYDLGAVAGCRLGARPVISTRHQRPLPPPVIGRHRGPTPAVAFCFTEFSPGDVIGCAVSDRRGLCAAPRVGTLVPRQ
jgi:hypothetical protein